MTDAGRRDDLAAKSDVVAQEVQEYLDMLRRVEERSRKVRIETGPCSKCGRCSKLGKK